MSKKTVKVLTIILLVLVILSVTAMFADLVKIVDGKKPLFSSARIVYEDGGTIEYIGLFYKIFDYKITDGKNSVEFGTWFKSYNKN